MISIPAEAPPWAIALARNIQSEIDFPKAIPVRMPTYTVTTLPDAAKWKDCWIKVSNETGGDTAAESDGTNWRRMQDRSIVV